jgi:hypothetical protein
MSHHPPVQPPPFFSPTRLPRVNSWFQIYIFTFFTQDLQKPFKITIRPSAQVVREICQRAIFVKTELHVVSITKANSRK